MSGKPTQGKRKPARVRVPALYHELGLLHWKLTRQHHPGDAALGEVAQILEAIIAVKDPRKLHAQLCALYGIEVMAHRPRMVDASEESLAFIVDKFRAGLWDAARCRELLGMHKTQFDQMIAERVAEIETRERELIERARANGGKLSAADY